MENFIVKYFSNKKNSHFKMVTVEIQAKSQEETIDKTFIAGYRTDADLELFKTNKEDVRFAELNSKKETGRK